MLVELTRRGTSPFAATPGVAATTFSTIRPERRYRQEQGWLERPGSTSGSSSTHREPHRRKADRTRSIPSPPRREPASRRDGT